MTKPKSPSMMVAAAIERMVDILDKGRSFQSALVERVEYWKERSEYHARGTGEVLEANRSLIKRNEGLAEDNKRLRKIISSRKKAKKEA